MEVEVQQLDQIDFNSNLMFGNPVCFIAFLAEIINSALSAGKNEDNASINIFEIIADAAAKRMGLSISAEQLQSII